MTRPVYEPSLTRTDRKLGFGTDQLFRRPAPSAHGAGAWARFQRVSDSDITVLNNDNTVVSGTAGSDVITDTSIFQINSNSVIEMLVDGLIAIVGHTVWATYDTTFRQISVWETSGTDYPIAFGGSSDDLYDPASATTTFRATTGDQLKLVVHQHSGGGQSLYGGGTTLDDTNWLEVQYLMPWQAP